MHQKSLFSLFFLGVAAFLGCASAVQGAGLRQGGGLGQACAEEPLGGGGSVYYVCDCQGGGNPRCEAGDDKNDGTNPWQPWQTYEKAASAFSDLGPGETIAFCRGGRFDASSNSTWVNTSCRADTPCVIRDYNPPWGNGSEERPVLYSNGTNGLDFSSPGEAVHKEGYRVLNLHLEGNGQFGVFVYNDVKDLTLCNLVIEGFGIGVHVAGANPPGQGSDGRNERIALVGSTIINNSVMGFLGACSGLRIEGNRFDNNGSPGETTTHSIYLTGIGDQQGPYPAQDVYVGGNDIYRNAHLGGMCQGTAIVAHGQFDGLTIKSNRIREDVGGAATSCWGISVDPGGYDTAEFFHNVAIRDNSVVNLGYMSIGVSACQECTIENNLIIQEQNFGAVGIMAPDRERNPDKGDREMTQITVRNNTIHFPNTYGGLGIQVGFEGTDHIVVSNAISYAGAGGHWNCFNLDLAPQLYYSDHNLCWYPNGGYAQWSVQAGTLEDWRKTGLDSSSLNVDPVFADPGGQDFTPGKDSPLPGQGDATHSSPTDILGVTRPSDPAIGAYEPLTR